MATTKSRRRQWVIIPAAVLLVVLFLVIGAWSMFKTELAAIGSITELEKGLYYMEYRGDYGFDGFLEAGGAASDAKMAEYLTAYLSKGFYRPKEAPEEGEGTPFACSTITVENAAGEQLFGRNFDWDDCTGIVVKTVPDNGYASVSTANLDFLGFGEGFSPTDSMMNSFMALASAYVPLDGMNEAGLCVADLVVGNGELGETHQDTGKPDLTTVAAIRLLLDRAATVEEAEALLKDYDMHSSAGMMHHLSVSDAKGGSIVIEYIDNVIKVTNTAAVTNFYLAPGASYGLGSDSSMALVRYEMLCDILDGSTGKMEEAEVKEALMAVSCGALNRGVTQWSIVYNKDALTLTLWFKENFAEGHSFTVNR